jgi:hypothetical protein
MLESSVTLAHYNAEGDCTVSLPFITTLLGLNKVNRQVWEGDIFLDLRYFLKFSHNLNRDLWE